MTHINLRAKISPWMCHKVRVVIVVKQWKKYGTIYKNLLRLKRITNSNIDDTHIYQAAMTRLGWYRQCGQSVFNYLLSPQVLAMPKVNRTDKRKSRPGLVDPYSLYRNCELLCVCSAVYETRMYGAMRGVRE